MKKLLLALLALPMLAAFTACDSDDDMPQVDLSFDFANVKMVNGQAYVVAPDTFKITAINIKAIRPDHSATNGPVSYALNGVWVGTNPIAPFGITLVTTTAPADSTSFPTLPVGKYTLTYSMPIYEEDCEIATGAGGLVINVVSDSTSIPADTTAAVNHPVDINVQ